MKILIIILTCLSFGLSSSVRATVSATSADTVKTEHDLTQFDFPFLLGDWYLVNPFSDEEHVEFLAIRLHIASDYQFSIEIHQNNNNVQHWRGEYSLNKDTLVLGLNSDMPQRYHYIANHNQLILNGISFMKGYPADLIGRWQSAEIKGDDILASNVSSVSLTLQPDFMFLFMAESSDGNLAVYQGLYYYEENNLVLVYEKGEQNSRYTVENNRLILESTDFDMYAVMDKIE